jgi:hypothetical protein
VERSQRHLRRGLAERLRRDRADRCPGPDQCALQPPDRERKELLEVLPRHREAAAHHVPEDVQRRAIDFVQRTLLRAPRILQHHRQLVQAALAIRDPVLRVAHRRTELPFRCMQTRNGRCRPAARFLQKRSLLRIRGDRRLPMPAKVENSLSSQIIL